MILFVMELIIIKQDILLLPSISNNFMSLSDMFIFEARTAALVMYEAPAPPINVLGVRNPCKNIAFLVLIKLVVLLKLYILLS